MAKNKHKDKKRERPEDDLLPDDAATAISSHDGRDPPRHEAKDDRHNRLQTQKLEKTQNIRAR